MNKALLVASIFCGLISTAQASVVKVSGADIDFYYDNTYYKSAVAEGNSITFGGLDFTAQGTVTTAKPIDWTSPPNIGNWKQNTGAFTVVARDGYVLNNLIHGAFFASYVAPEGTFVDMQVMGNIFSDGQRIGAYGMDMGERSNSTSGSFLAFNTDPDQAPWGIAWMDGQIKGELKQLSFDEEYLGMIWQSDKGSSNLGLQSVSYNFSVLPSMNNPVTPVPEPESFAMMLSGLGMMGFIARRRSKSSR